jgi:hypothetical protein
MAEYGAGTMDRGAGFSMRRNTFWSLEVGAHRNSTAIKTDERVEISYARVNYLVKRWNLESAQAKRFPPGAALAMRTQAKSSSRCLRGTPAPNSTMRRRRIYGSLKTDLFESSAFSHRIDTLQLGIRALQTRRRHARHLVRDPGPPVHRPHSRRHRVGLVVAPVQEGCVGRGWRNYHDGKLQAMAMFNF